MSGKIEIAVVYDKPSMLFESDALAPVQTGKAAAEIDLGIQGDNTGDNISLKYKYYGEETAFYLLWKNSKAEIKGVMLHNRLLNLADPKGEERELSSKEIDNPKNFISSLSLDEKNILKAMEDADILTCGGRSITSFFVGNMEEYFKASHIPESWDYALAVIKEDFPQIYPVAVEFTQRVACASENICVMRAEHFDALCEFKFAVLAKLEKLVDTSRPEIADGWKHTASFARFVGEYLTMIYVEYLRQAGKRVKEFPVVSVVPPQDEEAELKQVFGEGAAAIVMAINNNYAPYCGVMLQSIKEHASEGRNYDIVVLSADMLEHNQKLLESMSQKNISLRVVYINRYLKEINTDILITSGHFSVDMYFRFFIPKILKNYDKVLYLDVDMAALRDVAELYDTDIGDNWFGVIRDPIVSVLGFTRTDTFAKTSFLPYMKEKLLMTSPFNYFNSGVMLWNVKQTIKDEVYEKCMRKLKELDNLLYADQDILNSITDGKNVLYMPNNWNALWNVPIHWKAGHGGKAFETAMYYIEHAFILHYCSRIKPWNEPWRPKAHIFWEYARKTPFYEIILYKSMAASQNNQNAVSRQIPSTLLGKTFYYFFFDRAALKEKVKKRLQGHKTLLRFATFAYRTARKLKI